MEMDNILHNQHYKILYRGYILISLLIITSAFPPIFGYSIYLTLSGYSFGFSAGFPIAYFSALGGASACFWLSRTIFKQKVIRILARYPSMQAVIRAVEKKGFKLFTLIRLSPYPFNLLNFLFAATDIPFSHFVAGTALSLLKIALHIYIGANLTSFAKHILGEDGDEDMTEEQKTAEKIKFAAGIVGSIISFAVIAYVYKLAKEAIAEVKLEEDEEMQGFLNEEESVEVDDDNDH
ncbi:hypothetical protein BCV72DRAFT_248842 [Rhizopus microsporus var. microsporus]|uniref:Golgi apparatus membrane protein TVP38 n=1 Tax=Rhizopus microsporus var. microsporus TaxID=86635 RepID=A0A1X0R8Q0_RHIZD|nr:hypothetical protein BCV72DRAFT_248842 [Rhizopus microsporus var. microsporus]